MHFSIKSYLKNNCYHTAKHLLNNAKLLVCKANAALASPNSSTFT